MCGSKKKTARGVDSPRTADVFSVVGNTSAVRRLEGGVSLDIKRAG